MIKAKPKALYLDLLNKLIRKISTIVNLKIDLDHISKSSHYYSESILKIQSKIWKQKIDVNLKQNLKYNTFESKNNLYKRSQQKNVYRAE